MAVLLLDYPLPGVRRLTLNRPEKRNALSNELRGAILDALKAADADPAVRVSVLRGAGPAFSSGYDLSADNSVNQPYYSPGGPGQWARHVVDGWFTIWDLAKPVIAQVHGYCLGRRQRAGRVLRPGLRGGGRAHRLLRRLMSPPDNQFHPFLMGMRAAMEMFLTGDAITGTEAAARGFANRAVAAAELERTVLGVAERIALVPTELVADQQACGAPGDGGSWGYARPSGRAPSCRRSRSPPRPASSTAPSSKRDGGSVRDLLSQRDAAFGDYRELATSRARPGRRTRCRRRRRARADQEGALAVLRTPSPAAPGDRPGRARRRRDRACGAAPGRVQARAGPAPPRRAGLRGLRHREPVGAQIEHRHVHLDHRSALDLRHRHPEHARVGPSHRGDVGHREIRALHARHAIRWRGRRIARAFRSASGVRCSMKKIGSASRGPRKAAPAQLLALRPCVVRRRGSRPRLPRVRASRPRPRRGRRSAAPRPGSRRPGPGTRRGWRPGCPAPPRSGRGCSGFRDSPRGGRRSRCESAGRYASRRGRR